MSRAFVFPGQGTQRVGMGQALRARFAEARDVFDDAAGVLGYDMAAKCSRSTPDELRATLLAQPAIFTVNAAALAVVRSWGIDAAFMAGHSVGEISALYAAGVFDFATALRVVTRRAEIMSGVTANGAMVSVVGLDEHGVRRACMHGAALGAIGIGLHNGPEHFVLSGSVDAIDRAAEVCRDLGAIKVARLETQHAFHSVLMQPVVPAWRTFVQTVPLAAPLVPVVLNTTGAFARDAEDIRNALVEQVANTVRWCESVRVLAAAGMDEVVECGDTKVLGALVRAAAPDCTTVTMADPRSVRRLAARASEDSLEGGTVAVP